MKQTPQIGQRIVSKGEYVAVQVSRTALRISALVSAVVVLICIIMTVCSLSSHIGRFEWLAALVFGIMAFRHARGGLSKLQQAARLEKVTPLTSKNTALLPPVETLVRASSPSSQEGHNVLLRATVNDAQTPADQLLRATDGRANAPRPVSYDNQVGACAEPLQAREVTHWQSNQGQERQQEQRLRTTRE